MYVKVCWDSDLMSESEKKLIIEQVHTTYYRYTYTQVQVHKKCAGLFFIVYCVVHTYIHVLHLYKSGTIINVVFFYNCYSDYGITEGTCNTVGAVCGTCSTVHGTVCTQVHRVQVT